MKKFILTGVAAVSLFVGGFFISRATNLDHVQAQQNLLITSPSTLPTASVGVAYSQILTVSGGTAPYLWFLGSYVGTPNYPGIPSIDGLTLNSDTGELSGTPTTPGTYTLYLYVLDSSGSPLDAGLIVGAKRAEQAFTLVVN